LPLSECTSMKRSNAISFSSSPTLSMRSTTSALAPWMAKESSVTLIVPNCLDSPSWETCAAGAARRAAVQPSPA
jgi:hypothetical protein